MEVSFKKENKEYFRYGGKRYDYSGGNPWGGISADLDREIVYVSTAMLADFMKVQLDLVIINMQIL